MLNTILELLIAIPLAYIAFMHLLGPVLVFRSERQPAAYLFTQLDEREFFSRRSETFIMLDYEMRNLGFDHAGSSLLENSNTASYFTLYVKPGEALTATLTTIESPLGDFTYAEFSRIFHDGSSIEVNNAPISPLFPRKPSRMQLRYPHINTLTSLYEAMQRVLSAHHGSAMALTVTQGEAFQQLETQMNGELKELVQGGYYSARVIDGYRPITLKGAILFSWKSLWPWQTLRQRHDLQRSRRQLEQSQPPKSDQ